MVKILLVSHGPLAAAMKESGAMFFDDKNDAVETLGLFPSDSGMEFKDRIVDKINEMYTPDGVLVLADIFSGTPCNMTALAISELPDKKVECVVGVSLPLFLEALSMADSSDLGEIASSLEQLARSTVFDLRKKLGM